MANIENNLPDFFPFGDVIVEEEQHLYKVFDGTNNQLPKDEYILGKAPINEQRISAAVLQDGNDTTDYTRESNNETEDDVKLLPSSPSVNDSFYIGRDTEFGDILLEISTAGAGTWSLTWEYWNGSSWNSLSSVTDNTNDFQTAGNNVVSWDIPSDWEKDSIADTDDFYLVRARVSSFSSISDQPLAKRVIRGPKDNDNSIQEVTGIVNDSEYTFVGGTDYTLSDDSERIVWLNNDRPDPDTYFRVTYRTGSIIGRYIDSGNEELNTVESLIESSIESKLIDEATGVELDRIGELFGDVIGKRSGRNDKQYRIYLKSVVQSFLSRGTVKGIKLAISAATGVSIDDISINEDFQNNEYDVVIRPTSPIVGSLLEEVAESADPSGVEQSLTRFTVPDEEIIIDDSVSFTQGNQTSETLYSDDSASVKNGKKSSDTLFADDQGGVQTKASTTSDTLFADDVVNLNTNNTKSSDTLFSDDSATVDTRDINSAKWEPQTQPFDTDWNFFEWVEIVDITTSVSDSLFSDDTATTQTKASNTSDTMFADDSVSISTTAVAIYDTANWDSSQTWE